MHAHTFRGLAQTSRGSRNQILHTFGQTRRRHPFVYFGRLLAVLGRLVVQDVPDERLPAIFLCKTLFSEEVGLDQRTTTRAEPAARFVLTAKAVRRGGTKNQSHTKSKTQTS